MKWVTKTNGRSGGKAREAGQHEHVDPVKNSKPVEQLHRREDSKKLKLYDILKLIGGVRASVRCYVEFLTWRHKILRIQFVAFWNFKLNVLTYPRNCSLHAKSLKIPESANLMKKQDSWGF